MATPSLLHDDDDSLINRDELLRLSWSSLKAIFTRMGLGQVDNSALPGEKKKTLVNQLLQTRKVRIQDLTPAERESIGRYDAESVMLKTSMMTIPERDGSVLQASHIVDNCLTREDLGLLSMKQLQDVYIEFYSLKMLENRDVVAGEESVTRKITVSGDLVNNKHMIIDHLVDRLNLKESDLSKDLLDALIRSRDLERQDSKPVDVDNNGCLEDLRTSLESPETNVDDTKPEQLLALPEKLKSKTELPSHKLSVMHMYFLSLDSIRRLYTIKKMGLVQFLPKSGTFLYLDLPSKTVEWDEVLRSLADIVTWNDLNKGELKELGKIAKCLQSMQNFSSGLLWSELVSLPKSILNHFCFVKGLGHYVEHNRFLYTSVDDVKMDDDALGTRLLMAGITKDELKTYAGETLRQLIPPDFPPDFPHDLLLPPSSASSNVIDEDYWVSPGRLVFLKKKHLERLYCRWILHESSSEEKMDSLFITKQKMINDMIQEGQLDDGTLELIERMKESQLRGRLITKREMITALHCSSLTVGHLDENMMKLTEQSAEKRVRNWLLFHQVPQNPSVLSKTSLMFLVVKFGKNLFPAKSMEPVVPADCLSMEPVVPADCPSHCVDPGSYSSEEDEGPSHCVDPGSYSSEEDEDNHKDLVRQLGKRHLVITELDEHCKKYLETIHRLLIDVERIDESRQLCSYSDLTALPLIVLMDLYVLKGLGGFYKNSYSKVTSFDGTPLRNLSSDIVKDLLWIQFKTKELKTYAIEVLKRLPRFS